MTGRMVYRAVRLAGAAALVLWSIGCGALDVTDPTAVENSELDNAEGAELLRLGVLKALSSATVESARYGGLLADEFAYLSVAGTSVNERIDRRSSDVFAQSIADGGYDALQRVRYEASVALPRLRTYARPGAAEAHVAEMFAVRGFAALRLAEDFCPGFPLNDVVDYQPVYGPPLSTDEALEKALTDFDSAVVHGADSVRVLNFAHLGRARILLALGRIAEAGAAAAMVPTDYAANIEYDGTINQPNSLANLGAVRSVADRDGGTGLDFVSAHDPRVELIPRGTGADGVTGVYALAKYPTTNAPVVLGNSIEARLIEAEAALHRAEPATMVMILNQLRRDYTTLADTTDPGVDDARLDLLFRERAFWLFATGHRLGDLRRLIHVYGRPAESVFPAGAYHLGGNYGAMTSLPFPVAKEQVYNPAVTGCTTP